MGCRAGRDLTWAEVFQMSGTLGLSLLLGIWIGSQLRIPVSGEAAHE